MIILDIGSGSVGGALVAITPGKIPEIIFVVRTPIVFQENFTFVRLLESMKKTLAEVCSTLLAASGDTKVARIEVALASPWYASQTRIIKYAHPKSFEVTEKSVAELIDREIDLFRSSKLFMQSKQENKQPEIMESKNIQLKLNGYEVRRPFGKNATELEIALYVSMLPNNIWSVIKDVALRSWPHVGVHFSSFSFMAFDTIRDMFAGESSFLFVDISSEVTDISLVKDNVLLESISFSSGTNTFLRSLMKDKKTPHSVAVGDLKLFLEEGGTKEHQDDMEKLLAVPTKEWVTFFEDALAQFAKEFPIPRTIFYTTDDPFGVWFGNAIKQGNFARFETGESAFSVRLLGMKFLEKFVTMSDPASHDTFLSIEAIFANKLFKLRDQ